MRRRFLAVTVAAIFLAVPAFAADAKPDGKPEAGQAQKSAANKKAVKEAAAKPAKDAKAAAPKTAKAPKAAKAKSTADKAAKPKYPKPEADFSATTGETHNVVRGDTMWDLSGTFWKNKYVWPKLWSYNPHIRNPHWIFPGDKLFLSPPPPSAPIEPKEREITLVVEKLSPPEPAKPAAESKAAAGDKPKAEAPKRYYVVLENRAQDYISPDKVAKVATIRNKAVNKLMSAEFEDMELVMEKGGTAKAGDKFTLYNDAREVRSPSSGKPVGYHVHILGQVVVKKVDGDKVWAKVLTSYDVMENGGSVMAYREPVVRVEPVKAPDELSGMVLAGEESTSLFTSNNIVFLDKGQTDGLNAGSVVELPFPAGPHRADGYADALSGPIARAVIVSTQAKTSTAYIIKSRKAVEAGFQFVAAADSP